MDSPDYEVEEILNKFELDGEIYYTIKWKGFPLSSNTSEPASNLK
jgi:hypothetical protein